MVVGRVLADKLPDEPGGGNEREQEAVEVGEQLHLESRFPEYSLKVALRVAAEMMVGDVVGAPHPAVGRNGQQKRSAGLEPQMDRSQRYDVAANMLENVEKRDQVVVVPLEHRQ